MSFLDSVPVPRPRPDIAGPENLIPAPADPAPPPGFVLEEPSAEQALLDEVTPRISEDGVPPPPPGFVPEEPAPLTFLESITQRGLPMMDVTIGGAGEWVGERFGIESLRDLGRSVRKQGEAAQAAAPRTNFLDIDSLGDFGQWAKETAGEQLPVTGSMLAGGAAGFAIGGPLGAAIGAFLPALAMGIGETQSAIKQRDPSVEGSWYALAGGSAIAALDAIVPGKVGSVLVKQFGGGLAEAIARRALAQPVKQGLIKRTAKGAVSAMAVEGVTEAIQESISEFAAAAATDTPVDWGELGPQMLEAGAAGGLIGFGLGGLGGAASRGGREQQPPARDEEGEVIPELPEGALPAETLYPEEEEPQAASPLAAMGLTEQRAQREAGAAAPAAPAAPTDLSGLSLTEQRALRDKGETDQTAASNDLRAQVDTYIADFAQQPAEALDRAMTELGWDETTRATIHETIKDRGRALDQLAGEPAVLTTVEAHLSALNEQLATQAGEQVAGQDIPPPPEGFVPEGDRTAPVTVETSEDVDAAAATAAEDYTPAQGEANNRKLGHINWQGLDGSIEVASGGKRKGTNPETGEPWETTHTVPYGYWKGTKGADDMHVDVYWGPELEAGHPVYVMDELDPEAGMFRQHKTFAGFPSEAAVREAYLGTSSKTEDMIGTIKSMPVEQFREWVKDEENTTTPIDLQKTEVPTEKPAETGEEQAETEQASRQPGPSTLDALEAQDQVKIRLKEPIDGKGPDLVGSYTTQAGMHFVVVKGGSMGQTAVGPIEADNVESVEITKTREQVFEDRYGNARGEPFDMELERTRDGYETYLRALAKAIAGEKDFKRKMQLEQQFDDVADEIKLAKAKRAWVLAEGAYTGEPKEYLARGDLAGDDMTKAMSLVKPKPYDFAPPEDKEIPRPEPEPDDMHPRNIIRTLKDAGFAAIYSVFHPEGDPNNAILIVTMPGGKKKGRFEATAHRTRETGWTWEIAPYEPNSSDAAIKRIASARVSDDYKRLKQIFDIDQAEAEAAEEEVDDGLPEGTRVIITRPGFAGRAATYEAVVIGPRRDMETEEITGYAVRRPDRAKVEHVPLAWVTVKGELTTPEKEEVSSEAPAKTKDELYKVYKRQMVRFASGMSRVGDLVAGSWALGDNRKKGIGVDVGELTGPAIDQLGKAVAFRQTQVFVDSGAFSMFRRKLRGKDLKADFEGIDFNAVLERYDEILSVIDDYNAVEERVPPPLLVMPDVVGDQAASLALVERYAKWIAVLAGSNIARPIVPIQKGDLTLAEAYAKVVETLGTDQFITGVPSNEKAVSNDELREFVAAAKPRGLHFLGSVASKTLQPKLEALAETGVEFEHLSADANFLRSALYGRKDTDKPRSEAISETLGEMGEKVPTREEFEAMVARGRLRQDSPLTPTEEDLAAAETPVEYGRLYGYSEDDIAHFYSARRRGHQMAYDEYVADLEHAAFEPAKIEQEDVGDIFDEALDEEFGPSQESVDQVKAALEGTDVNPETDEELVNTAAGAVDDGKPVEEAVEEAVLELDANSDEEAVIEAVEEEIGVIPTPEQIEEVGDALQQPDTQTGGEEPGQTAQEGEAGGEGGATTGGPKTPGGRATGGKKKSAKAVDEEKAKKLAEKIKREQKAKQERLEDAGEKIGGARKDEWRDRGLELGDIAKMTDAEKITYITKENVWPRPNYDAMVKGGTTPEAAFLVKTIYDRIGTKPVEGLYDEFDNQTAYVSFVGAIRSIAMDVKTVDDAKAINKAIEQAQDAGAFGSATLWRLLAIAGRRVGRRSHQSLYLGVSYSDLTKAATAVEEGFPNMAPWRRLYKVRKYGTNKIDTGGFADVYRVYRKNGGRIGDEYKTLAEAEAAAAAAYEAEKKGGDGEKMPDRPHLDEVKRIGPDYRQGRNVDSQDFIDAFGFRGVEFGKWVASDERQKVVNLAYDALMDLARILGVPPKVLSLTSGQAITEQVPLDWLRIDGASVKQTDAKLPKGAKVSIARPDSEGIFEAEIVEPSENGYVISKYPALGVGFGSRGRGGRAAAHYEWHKLVINMTKLKGAGSLAHEWAHALDHYLGELDHPEAYKREPDGISGWRLVHSWRRIERLPPRLRKAAYDLMLAIHAKEESIDSMRARLDKEVAEAKRNMEGWARQLRRMKRPSSSARWQYEQWRRIYEKRKARRENPTVEMRGTERTSFFEEAERLSGSGDYWKRGTEMFARSFESYVFDRLTAEGNQSQYLVQGVEPTRFAEGGYKGNPYPVGEEREAINKAYDALFDEIEATDGKNGAATRIIGTAGEIDEAETVDTSVPVDLGDQVDTSIEDPGVTGGKKPDTDKRPDFDPLVKKFHNYLFNSSNRFESITDARKFAAENGFEAKAGTTETKELEEKLEAAIVLTAQSIVKQAADPEAAFLDLIGLYRRQPNLSARTAKSIVDQAYSTPIPLAYLVQKLAGIDETTKVYEPTAGNGSLIFTANPENVFANEIDETRANHLKAMGFAQVHTEDASTDAQAEFVRDTTVVDVVVGNPPFGAVKERDGSSKVFTVKTPLDQQQGWKTTQIDHAIALNALSTLKEGGRAVLIVGSVKEASDRARAEAYNTKGKREFYWRVYQAYNVVDHFTVSGDLYKKQGASWPVDVIVIDGHGKSARPLPAVDLPRVYTRWPELMEKLNDVPGTVPEGAGSTAIPDRGGTGEEAGAGGQEGLEGGGPAGEGPAGGSAPLVGGLGPDVGQPGELRPDGDRPERTPTGEQPATGTPGTQVEPDEGGEPAGSGGAAGDLGDVFDEALAEEFGPTEEQPPAPTERPPRTAGQAAGEAVKEAGKGLDDVAAGLAALFNDPNKLGAGPAFDEETWAKAKPLFQQAMQHFKAAATNAAEAMRLLIRELRTNYGFTREALERMKPYVVRFIEEFTAAPAATERPAPTVPETEAQKAYTPRSTQNSLNTLVPTNMLAATNAALADVEARHGPLDAWIAEELGYKPDELGKYLAAEQVDAVALALDNVQKGGAFVIGDQTGIGKGRVVAAMLRYALRNRLSPIFVTHAPNLYGDIVRDLNDIDVPGMLDRDMRIFVTNRDADVPLDREAIEWFADKEIARAEGTRPPPRKGKFLKSLGSRAYQETMGRIQTDGNVGIGKAVDMVFTTYSQMQTLGEGKPEPPRRNMIRALAPNAFLVMDESHLAGGAGVEDRRKKGGESAAEKNRAEFFREIAGRARAAMFSSATYAKRPNIMDLYSRTDMGKAVEDPKMLGELIGRGGVPMQQVVAAMLTQAGQYLRRERSFEGVEYGLEPVEVDVSAYNDFSESVARIYRFDTELKNSDWWRDMLAQFAAEASGAVRDPSMGEGGATSASFSSVMHNIVSQMLLAIKADSVANQAIASLERGEKPTITLANTMGSFIKDYVESFELNKGDNINLSFRDVIQRYLTRTMRITIKDPFGNKRHVQVPVDRLPAELRELYDAAADVIQRVNIENMPVSPIDWIRHRIEQAGYNVGEITGRQHVMRYSGVNEAEYDVRSSTEIAAAGRRVTIDRFNNEDGGNREIHAIILNRAGSTGLSLHASKDFVNQKRRRMIIAQAEGNIDEHMQLLGRVHRTGQVIPPAYSQAYADVPAEARPAAVLAKKMASLNANTTAARTSSFTSEEAVDFLNKYGDRIVAEILRDDPGLQALLNLRESEKGTFPEDVATKFTGKLTILHPDKQREILDQITVGYTALIEALDAAGENALEAKTIDLQAKTIEREKLKDAKGDSPFQQAVYLETVEVKSEGKALAPAEILNRVKDSLGLTFTVAGMTNLSQGFEQASREAGALHRRFSQKWREDHNKFTEESVKAFKNEETRQQHRAKEAETAKKWQSRYDMVAPGHIVRMKFGDESLVGISMAVNRRQTAGRPLALGNWSVEIAIPDNKQRIIAPFSSLELASEVKESKEEGTKGITIEPPGWTDRWPNVLQAFEKATTEGTETRHIITGNILAGYDTSKGRGQILNYTNDAGEINPGILMKRGFDAGKFMEERPVRFTTAAQVMEFGERTGADVVSRDDIVTVRRESWGQWEIDLPAAKISGGKYYTLPQVVEASKNGFAKAGSRMRLRSSDDAMVQRVLQAMMDAGALFQTTKEQKVAEEIIKGSEPEQSVGSTVAKRQAAPRVKLDPRQQKNLERNIRARIQSIFGKGIPIHLTPIIPAAGAGSPEYNAAMERYAASGGVLGDTAGGVFTTLRNGEFFVKIATQDPKFGPLESASHEAYHAVEAILMTDAEFAAVNTQAAVDEARMWAAKALKTDPETLVTLPGYEIRAIGFEAFMANHEALKNAPGLPGALRRFFNKLRRLVLSLRKLFDQRGIKSWADIAEDIAEGRMTDREFREPRLLERTEGERALGNTVARPQIPEEGTPERGRFDQWFGNSKVVDKQGRPLRVFHGTESDFEAFDAAFLGENSWHPTAHLGFFFTPSVRVAQEFAGHKGAGNYPDDANIMPVYLSIQRPYEIPFDKFIDELSELTADEIETFADQLWEQDYDGIHILPDLTKAGPMETEATTDSWVAFRPEQIKSATGNQGTFSRSEESILLSGIPHESLDPFHAGGVSARQHLMLNGLSIQPVDRAIRLAGSIFGGLNEKNELKLGLALSKKSGQILTEAKFSDDSRFSWINGLLHVARAGLVDRYGLDEGYVARERQRGLEERADVSRIPEVLTALKNGGIRNTSEAAALQDILTGEAPRREDWDHLSEPIRNSIDAMGQEAVDLGLISAESFERNRGSYLHRVYMKHENDQGGLARWVSNYMTNRRRKIIGEEVKGRGLFKLVDRQKIPTGPGERVQNGAKYVRWDKMSADESKVLKVEYRRVNAQPPEGLGWENRGEWEVRGTHRNGKVILWRDYTRAERERMGEIFDARYTIAKTYMMVAHDLSVGRFYRDISENRDWVRDSEPADGTWKNAESYKRHWASPDIEWVKVPTTKIEKSNTKRYGALAGKYVRASIWRDINELEVLNSSNFWRSMLTQWKLNKTARSPVVHMNNIMSNLLLMDMSGVGAIDLAAGVRALITKDAIYQEAESAGALGSDMITNEIRQNVLEPILKEIEAANGSTIEGRVGILGKIADNIFSKGALAGAMYGAAIGGFVGGPVGGAAGAGVGALAGTFANTPVEALDRKMLNAYRLEDEVFRLALYHRRRAEGIPMQEAADEAREQFIDYDIRAPWINVARRTALPFLSYIYRAAPIVAKTIMTRPWKMAKYFAVLYGVQTLAYMLVPGDEDEERRSMREEEQGLTWVGAPRMIRLPSADIHGNPHFIDVRRWIPAGDIFDMNQGSSALEMIAPLQLGGPLMLGAEYALNKQAFTGREITNDLTDDWWDRTSKVGDWAWKSWMPSAAWVPGSWYWNKIGNAIKGGRGYDMEPLSLYSAAASSVGIKVRAVDVAENMKVWGLRFDRIEREIKAARKRLSRDYARNLISQEDYEAQFARFTDKLGDLAERRRRTFLGE